MTHHAYVYEGSLGAFEELKASLSPYLAQKFDRFGVDDARELIARAALKPVGQAVFLVAFSSTTSEAQQALLKLLEEPQSGVSFVFLVPYGTLLPTVRSRMMAWEKTDEYTQTSSRPALSFLRAAQKERSDMIAALLKDEEGLRERVRDLLDALEQELSKDMKDVSVREGLQDIAKVRDYLRDRSPSLKMLLEHLALSLPKK